jgi:hypothetical protein
MRLAAITEALSKPLAQKVHKQLVDLATMSDQQPMSFAEFMTYVRDADVHSNMPYGNYILKIYSYLISRMEQHARKGIEDERDDGILAIDVDIDETIRGISENLKFYVKKFNTHKGRMSAAGLDTDINSYLPKQSDGNMAFAPIERVLRQLGEQAETDVNTRGLPGVRLLRAEKDADNDSITYRLYHVTNPQSLSDIAMGFAGGDEIGWCTKSEKVAADYIATNDNYVIFRNNNPTSQFSINKVGPTGSNPFAQINKISEHKNSQNEDERRQQMQRMAQQTEEERNQRLRTEMAGQGLDLDSYQEMLQTVRFFMQGDAEATIKSRYSELRDALQRLNLPLLKQQFEKAGHDFATTIASIAGTYELGLPSESSEMDKQIPYKDVWREIFKRLEESESFLERDPRSGSNPQVTQAIMDAIRKGKESNVKAIRLVLTLVHMNKNIAASV